MKYVYNVVNLERFVFPNFPEKHYPKKSKENAMTINMVNSQLETAKKTVRFQQVTFAFFRERPMLLRQIFILRSNSHSC